MLSRLLLRALLVERDETGKNFLLLGQVDGPAVGLRHEFVEPVVILLQDQYEAIFENTPFGGVERPGRHPRPQFFQNVVKAGQRQMRMFGEHALAMRIEVFGDGADALLLQVVGGGEREGVEAAGFGVYGIVANAEPASRA